jgi:hypothetical protein
VFTGPGVGEGEFETASVLVGGKVVEVAVSIGTIVLIGSEVVDGIDVAVGVEGWKGVGVEVEFGATVTRLKSGI